MSVHSKQRLYLLETILLAHIIMENLSCKRQCRYCDLHEFSFDNGIVCTLTGRPSEFRLKCPKIKFADNLNKKIFHVEGNLDYLNYSRPRVKITFISLLGASLLIFAMDIYASKMIFERGFVSTISISLLIVGFLVLGRAIQTMKSFQNRKNDIHPKKEELEKMKKLYGLNYDFSSSISTDILGNQRSEQTLKINGDTYHRTVNLNARSKA